MSLLEVFDAARYARHIALSQWLYRSDKGFGYTLEMDALPEATRLSKARMCKETNVGGETMSRGSSRILSFFYQYGYPWKGKETYVEGKGHLSRSLG